MRRIGWILLVAVLLVAQVGFIPALRPFGVVPDVALVVVIITGLEATVSQALILALVGGLMLDVSSGADFGLRTGILVLAALATGAVRRAGIELVGPVVALVMVIAATILESLFILGNLVGATGSWPVGAIAGKLAVLVVLNLTLTLALRPLLVWLQPPGNWSPAVR